MRTKSISMMLTAVFALGMLVSACDEAEQGRPLRHQEGTYLGPKDEPLSDKDRDALRLRTRMQQGT